jgi:uncharacterized membrane protein
MHFMHAWLASLPIILFTTALIADLFYAFGKGWGFTLGHCIVFVGSILCIPVIFTGFAISGFYNPEDLFLQKHTVLGIFTGIAAGFYSIMRFAAMRGKWLFPLSIYIGCSMVMMGLVSWTADLGQLIGKEETVKELKILQNNNLLP